MTSKITSTKIKETLARIAELRAVQRHFDVTLDQYEAAIARKDALDKELIDELEDINALEKLGVRSIFHKVLGNKEEQLEKERQEYLQVTLKHKEALNAIEVIEFEKEILEKKLVELDDQVDLLAQLKDQREKEILQASGPVRNELVLYHQKIDQLDTHLVELNEASKAGEAAYQSLHTVHAHMKKAKEWGSWDMMGGNGSRYHKSMKHGAIDRAMREVSRSQLILRTFNKELEDIGYGNRRLGLQVESISKFPGMIFDNLISDWIVQNKIKSVLSTVSSLMDDLRLTLQNIQRESEQIHAEIKRLAAAKDKFLEEN